MKDSVKFLIPLGSSRKIVDPPSLFVKISCDPPTTTKDDVVPWAGGLGGVVKSPGQSLGGGPGVEHTEAPKIQEFLTVKRAKIKS